MRTFRRLICLVLGHRNEHVRWYSLVRVRCRRCYRLAGLLRYKEE